MSTRTLWPTEMPDRPSIHDDDPARRTCAYAGVPAPGDPWPPHARSQVEAARRRVASAHAAVETAEDRLYGEVYPAQRDYEDGLARGFEASARRPGATSSVEDIAAASTAPVFLPTVAPAERRVHEARAELREAEAAWADLCRIGITVEERDPAAALEAAARDQARVDEWAALTPEERARVGPRRLADARRRAAVPLEGPHAA